MKKTKSVIVLFLCAFIWGLSFVAQVRSRSMTPFAYNGIRYFLGAATVTAVSFIFDRKKQSDERRKATLVGGIITGFVLATAANLQQIGIFLGTQAGKAGFFTGLYTVLVPILALIIFRKKTNLFTWAGVLLAAAGLYMLCMTDSFSMKLSFPDVLVLLSALFWALHIITIDHFTQKGVSALKYSAVQFFTCAFVSTAFALIFEDINFADVWETRLEILYGGFLTVGAGFTLQTIGQKGVEPALSAIIMSTESVFSVVCGAIILKERLPFPSGYLGCIAMFAAIVISQIEPKNKKTA